MSGARDRPYGACEIQADRWVHRIGIAAGLAATLALFVMLAARADVPRLLAGAIYASGLMAMLTLSAAYNLAPPSRRRDLLQRFDHAAIFVMIAGTYTPIALLALKGPLARAILIVPSCTHAKQHLDDLGVRGRTAGGARRGWREV